MEQKLAECLKNQQSGKHILPFFWQHGEEYEILAEEMDAIYGCGIREFCVESRVHEQFGEERWWEDFAFILEEARKRNMRVWLLDDKFFPTGYANNYISEHTELRINSLRVNYLDYTGPQSEMAFIPERLEEGESYVSIVAYRRKQNGNCLCGEGINLISKKENGLLWWDIPDGVWRIYYVIKTNQVCSPKKLNYINMLSAESCKAMLHAVYEPHYEHFAEYFGNTFAGFFSDEPCFGNDDNSYESLLGKEGMLLPWCDELPKCIAKKTGCSKETVLCALPALWHEVEEKTPAIREAYMETITEMYRKNFNCLLGDWCRAHGVMYIGHIIEDENTHQRLGFGAGHFFRAMDGQDMAGIDIVLNQMIPGHTELEHTARVVGSTVDPKFFNYTLAKLASSHSHIQPLKKNRAMCEVFGAFGWAEGIPMMKYLVDHMLVNGINYFVPHAFSPKYPDRDCPPHFYARGMNSQYLLFGELMQYTARMAHVLTDGVHRADVAVYYNAEAEWAGGKYMLQQEVCYALTRRQIDFDLIPQDVLVRAECVDGRLQIHKEQYKALIIPYSQYLPASVIDAFSRLSKAGVPVIFVDKKPDRTSEMGNIGERLQTCEIVELSRLAEELSSRGYQSVIPEKRCEHLRFYHIERNGGHYIQLWNEDIFQAIDTYVTLPVKGNAVFYDGWKNQLFLPEQKDECTLRIKLEPAKGILACIDALEGGTLEVYDYEETMWQEPELDWRISLRDAKEDIFREYERNCLGNLARELPDFVGVIRYEAMLEVSEGKELRWIDLGRVGECAQLWVNDEYCGSCVYEPCQFDVRKFIHPGENQLRIEVMNNLGYRGRDKFSAYLPLPPTGLLGPVKMK